jgi:RNA-directed DNA polymerase
MINPLTTPNELARLLGTSYSKLTYVIYVKKVENFYSYFQIEKNNGEKRTIRAPHPQLKIIQQRLKTHLEKLYEPHPAAAAFIPGRGIVYNAKKHLKKAIVLNLDLEDFYDQIHFGRVRGLLMAKPYSLQKDTARVIAHLCCVDRLLPQGAPSSPLISNMICRRLDKELSFLAKNSRAHYSRYADDITFSFRNDSENEIYSFVDGVLQPGGSLKEIIESNGFSLNRRKTRLQNSRESQVVTGLKVNLKVNVDRRFFRKTKAMIHSLSRDVENANSRFSNGNAEFGKRLEWVVSGRINYIGMVKGRGSGAYQTLAQKFNNLDVELKVPQTTLEKNSDIEQKLHFYGYENKTRLERSVWVVCFEDEDGITDDEKLVQGTAFMMKGYRLFTAAHVFAKAGDHDQCSVYLIKEPGKKFKAKVVYKCNLSDVCELEFFGDKPTKAAYLSPAPIKELNRGYKLSAIGFPQILPGHQSVTILPCTVTNIFIKSKLKHSNVDADFQAGISGGPVLNAYMQVVGMAVLGQGATFDDDSKKVYLEGSSAFLSIEHFPNMHFKQVPV